MTAMSEAVAAHVRHDEPCQCSPLVKAMAFEARVLVKELPTLVAAFTKAVDKAVTEAEQALPTTRPAHHHPAASTEESTK